MHTATTPLEARIAHPVQVLPDAMTSLQSLHKTAQQAGHRRRAGAFGHQMVVRDQRPHGVFDRTFGRRHHPIHQALHVCGAHRIGHGENL